MSYTNLNYHISESELLSNETLTQSDTNEKVKSKATEHMTKRQLKKLQKKLKWEQYKPIKRARERELLKQKKMLARMNNIKLGPSRKQLKNSTMAKSNCSIRVAIDLSLDYLMDDHSMSKCIKQILRVYSLNRRAQDPMQLYITSFEGRSKEEMNKNDGYQNWDINFESKHYENCFDKNDIIYLTSESENVIHNFEDNKVYIIGGLVDHNSQKGLCHKIALEKGLNHGRLPLEEYLDMKSRKVLTIDHVFAIILGKVKGLSWKDVLLDVLPQRKGAVAKNKSNEEEKEIVDDQKEYKRLKLNENQPIPSHVILNTDKNGIEVS